MSIARELRAAAVLSPERTFLLSSQRELSYADVLTAAEQQGRGLLARGVVRFAAVVDDPIDLIVLLFAAALAGAEPCGYPRDLDAPGVEDYTQAFDHQTVVTNGQLELAGPTVISLADLPVRTGPDLPQSTEDAGILVLTTGTTGRPKGARHEWSRLIPPPDRVGAAEARWLLAYNLNQFAGLQVLLQALVSRASIVIPESNQPRQALVAMRDLGVTHAGGTPTFWRFICSLLDADPSHELALRQITLGGEAVSESLLALLGLRFPDARISQIYASTELGSTVSVRDGRAGLPISVLSRGPEADVQFRIVDGELQGKSRVGMVGYHGQDVVNDGWLRTGDLVEVHGDRIVFVGRDSEVINVGGVKVHPLPIETVIASVEGVETSRVYGRSNPVTGQIVVADVVLRSGVDEEALEDAIREACASLPRAAQPRRIRFVEELGVRENKVVRQTEVDR